MQLADYAVQWLRYFHPWVDFNIDACIHCYVPARRSNVLTV